MNKVFRDRTHNDLIHDDETTDDVIHDSGTDLTDWVIGLGADERNLDDETLVAFNGHGHLLGLEKSCWNDFGDVDDQTYLQGNGHS